MMKSILLSLATLAAALAISGCVVGPGQYVPNSSSAYDPATQTQEDNVRDSNANTAADTPVQPAIPPAPTP